ncbi:UNVERIFIED_ORG: hypothetical protein J2Y77_000685 [Pseudomonas lini]|uniref:Lipoprotein n=1 Tax=Pseudomonas viciae TaxID=2505979 RepID=A0A4P7PF60_9PSED|nr:MULTISPECIES: hypothetical protein [Pseudomonas]MBC3362665.1 hypothetical protein [Pseudomonas sp. SWRI154]QBZ88773.1 hypothetical protein EPZ47_08630 [Pseudomonas viciae]UZE88119.1 hypothetical protein LOY66_08540 [Pseudomonas viciae]WGO95099.1 hypothetical protein QCD61_08450 [Pseudomonas viciae]WHS62017.1 hypothetical protein QNH97_08225 [Pseudomonas sp. G2-4]
MKARICLPLVASLMVLALAGCAGKTAYRDSCGSQLDSAWRELDLAKAEGFAGTVSYSKALSLLTGAKTQQQFEAFEGCSKKAEKARFYIRESRAGR